MSSFQELQELVNNAESDWELFRGNHHGVTDFDKEAVVFEVQHRLTGANYVFIDFRRKLRDPITGFQIKASETEEYAKKQKEVEADFKDLVNAMNKFKLRFEGEGWKAPRAFNKRYRLLQNLNVQFGDFNSPSPPSSPTSSEASSVSITFSLTIAGIELYVTAH